MVFKEKLGLDSESFIIPTPKPGVQESDIMDSLWYIKEDPKKKWLFDMCNQHIYICKVEQGFVMGKLVSNDSNEFLL